MITSKRIYSSLALLLYFFMPTPQHLGHTQVSSGTAVVILYSKYKIVFAAESRVVIAGKSIRYRDDACKVRAIKNRFIFVSAGINGFGPDTGETGNAWSAYDEPGKLAVQIPDTAEDPVNSLAKLWGESVEYHLNQSLLVNPDPTIRFWRQEDRQGLTTGVFAGLTRQRQFVIYRAVLNCNCDDMSRHAFLTISQVPLPDRLSSTAMGSEQALALFHELIEGKSERAKMSTDKFEADHAGMKGQELLGAAVVASLEFILKYAESEGIGGPVDAVEISSTGDIHWIQRKANCPDGQ